MLQRIGNQSKSMVCMCLCCVLYCFVLCLCLFTYEHTVYHASFNCLDSILKVRQKILLNRSKLMAHGFLRRHKQIRFYTLTWYRGNIENFQETIWNFEGRLGIERYTITHSICVEHEQPIYKRNRVMSIFWAFYLSLICLLILIISTDYN